MRIANSHTPGWFTSPLTTSSGLRNPNTFLLRLHKPKGLINVSELNCVGFELARRLGLLDHSSDHNRQILSELNRLVRSQRHLLRLNHTELLERGYFERVFDEPLLFEELALTVLYYVSHGISFHAPLEKRRAQLRQIAMIDIRGDLILTFSRE